MGGPLEARPTKTTWAIKAIFDPSININYFNNYKKIHLQGQTPHQSI
jgi:hypothetical protein